jgi:hypothetical protein
VHWGTSGAGLKAWPVETFLNLLKQQGELFVCSEIDDYERYWDKVRESFA